MSLLVRLVGHGARVSRTEDSLRGMGGRLCIMVSAQQQTLIYAPGFRNADTSIFVTARALYMYQAAIPEELGFSKGDVLAVLRHQDDGWWEATIQGGNGQV